MDRRESLKSLLIGGVVGATIGIQSCKPTEAEAPVDQSNGYGRTPDEQAHDKAINEGIPFFSNYELETIAVLCDLILPPSSEAGGALDAEVPAFIEFMVKDLPNNQIPLRGGIMWLHGESTRRYEKNFLDISETERTLILDDIAYPDKDNKTPELEPGRAFFTRIRNLTLTGYYTSKIGIQDLGYVGNRPNIWDGVPQDVLDDHGMSYDADWLAKCINQETREVKAVWDDQGKLIS